MGARKYPPLSRSEVISILKEWGFQQKNQEGSHRQMEGRVRGERRVVTVDMAESAFDDFLIKSMLSQSGLTREEFYGATKKTAKRASVPTLELGTTPASSGDIE